jgi:hypothetical protein
VAIPCKTGWFCRCSLFVRKCCETTSNDSGCACFAGNSRAEFESPQVGSTKISFRTCSVHNGAAQFREKSPARNLPGTHRGHIKLFLAALGTLSSAFRFLWFLTFTTWPPAFTAVTRVQIPSGTPNLLKCLAIIGVVLRLTR